MTQLMEKCKLNRIKKEFVPDSQDQSPGKTTGFEKTKMMLMGI